jgi:nucleoside-diphosphate-sugar epimerase
MATALIAGALGVVGRALVEHLEDDPEWSVIGLSRRAPDFETTAEFISVDLLEAADCQAKLAGLSNVTHIFFTPYAARASFAEEVVPNLAMLTNLVEVIEPVAPDLEHIQLMQGAKWYGVQFGAPYKTPAKEDDPRHMPPNFYYDQQDWLVARQEGKSWTWSGLRPHGVWGFSVGSEMNMLTSLAVYATISRAMVWTAATPAATNEAFNITNGDYTRWHHLWPRIAEFFDMEVGPVQTVHLQTVMADKEPVWAEICEQYQLHRYTIDDLATWRFLDYAFANGFDQMSSLTKIRQAGWTEVLDTEDTVTQQLQRLRADRIIP